MQFFLQFILLFTSMFVNLGLARTGTIDPGCASLFAAQGGESLWRKFERAELGDVFASNPNALNHRLIAWRAGEELPLNFGIVISTNEGPEGYSNYPLLLIYEMSEPDISMRSVRLDGVVDFHVSSELSIPLISISNPRMAPSMRMPSESLRHGIVSESRASSVLNPSWALNAELHARIEVLRLILGEIPSGRLKIPELKSHLHTPRSLETTDL